jgi:hypothetical protein
MNKTTESERVFKWFCKGLDITCEKMPEGQQKTPTGQKQSPDYDIVLGGHKVIAEVKQFELNPRDKEALLELRTVGTAASFPQLHVRIWREIRDAADQMKERGDFPAVLVIFDQETLGEIDPTDIKLAMFAGRPIDPFVSAVGWLRDGDTPTLCVYHNHLAMLPLDPDWLRHERFQHCGLDATTFEWRHL